MSDSNEKSGGNGSLLITPKVEPHGKGAKLLPEHMRKLPGDIVTEDIAEGDKIHELDPPHIRSNILDEQKAALKGKPLTESEVIGKLKSAGPGETVPISQFEVDIIRFRIVAQRIKTSMGDALNGVEPNTELMHIFFPDKRNVNQYELRPGKPRNYLPEYKHQKDLDTIVDIFDIPTRLKDYLKSRGIDYVNFRQRYEDARRMRELQERQIIIANSLGVL